MRPANRLKTFTRIPLTKRKVRPGRDNEGPEREQKYRSTLSLTSEQFLDTAPNDNVRSEAVIKKDAVF